MGTTPQIGVILSALESILTDVHYLTHFRKKENSGQIHLRMLLDRVGVPHEEHADFIKVFAGTI